MGKFPKWLVTPSPVASRCAQTAIVALAATILSLPTISRCQPGIPFAIGTDWFLEVSSSRGRRADHVGPPASDESSHFLSKRHPATDVYRQCRATRRHGPPHPCLGAQSASLAVTMAGSYAPRVHPTEERSWMTRSEASSVSGRHDRQRYAPVRDEETVRQIQQRYVNRHTEAHRQPAYAAVGLERAAAALGQLPTSEGATVRQGT